MDSQTKTKTVNLEDLQISIQDVHNKIFGNSGTCATAAATAEKTVTLGTTFSLVAGANVLLKFTNGISCENATLAVTHTTLDGTTVTESAKPIYYRGSALFAGLVAAGDMLLLRYNGTQFDVVGVLDKSSTMYTKTEVNALIADFITASVNNLVNYYLKSDTYSASQIDQMLAAISQFRYEVVQTLPTASASTMNKIYLVPATSTKTRNVKDEFITIATTETVDDEEVTTYSWEQIGSTAIDLSNYYTKQQTDSEITSALNTALSAYTTTADLNTLLAGKQNTIDSSHKLSADLVDDSQSTNKFVSANEKQTWNNKQDAIEFNTAYNATTNKAATMADVPTAMAASGSGHKGGLVPDPGETAGTSKYLREDGTWAEPEGGSAAAYTPTLNAAPTSSTTTYTKDGQTVTFEIGQFARVADASADAGYVMYQLYDLNNGVATWQELGSPLERVRITLLADSSAAPAALRSAATIKITSAKSGVVYNDTIPADGVTIAKIEPNDTYTVEAEDVNGFITPQAQSFTAELANVNNVNINYIDSDLSHATVTCVDQTYSGSAQTPTPVVTLNGNIIPSSNYDVAYSNNTNAGTATVTVTGKGDYSGTGTGTFTIAKAAPTYTAPTGVQLTYSGSAQAVITAGSTSDGTIQYSSDGENWSTTRPTGTNAGSYTAYWKLVGDANHTDVASTQVSSAIAKADASYTAPTVASLTYNGQAQALLTAGSTSDGTLQYSADGENWSTNIPTGTNAGSYTSYWRIVGDANHNDKASVSLTTTIAKASRTITFTTSPTEVEEGDTITVAASVSAGSGDGTISYSSGDTSKATVSGSTVTGVSGGQVSIIAVVSEGTNYLGASTSYTLTVTTSMITGYIILDQTSTDPTTKVLDESNHGYSGYERPAVITAIRNASHCYVGTFANNKMSLKQLDDSDGTKYADGTSASTDIATTGKDVFMRLPYFFTRVSTYATDKIKIEFAFDPNQTVTTTAQPDGNGWKQWGGNDLIGKYEAYETSNKTYSRSGVDSTSNVSQANMKSHARARGTGFTIVKWRHQNIMAILFYAYYGNTNCQTICGSGYNGHSGSNRKTGLKNSLGMTDTTSSNGNTNNIVFWGLENWWGCKHELVDNVVVSSGTWTITEDDGTTRTLTSGTHVMAANDSWVCPSKFYIGDDLDVVGAVGQTGGSDSRGYCDWQYISRGSPLVARRSAGNASTEAGVAYVSVANYSSDAHEYFGSRLAFTGTIEIV